MSNDDYMDQNNKERIEDQEDDNSYVPEYVAVYPNGLYVVHSKSSPFGFERHHTGFTQLLHKATVLKHSEWITLRRELNKSDIGEEFTAVLLPVKVARMIIISMDLDTVKIG